MSDKAIAVVALLAGANWEAEALYTDAFLDRGKKGKEPRLHLLRTDDGMTPYAFFETIDKPGHTAWAGFRERTSTLVLAGRLALHGGLPFLNHAQDYHPYVTLHTLNTWAGLHLAPKDRPWGREAQGCIANPGWWYCQEGAFFLPKDIRSLPRIRDVLADPPKDAIWKVADLRAALRDITPELRDDARLTVAYTHDTHETSSAHQRLAAACGIRDGLATALQYQLNLRTFGSGHTAPKPPGTSIVPQPLWIGDIVLPQI